MQRPPLDRTARKLIAAMLLRAVRDLGHPDWRCEALTWLAGDGRELGEMIGIDVDVTRIRRETKGQNTWQT